MTFVQRRNRLTTHFSERIPVVKRRISILGGRKHSVRYLEAAEICAVCDQNSTRGFLLSVYCVIPPLAYANKSLIDLITSSSIPTKLRFKRMARRQEESMKGTGEVNVKDLKGDAEDGEPWEFFLWTCSGVYNIKV